MPKEFEVVSHTQLQHVTAFLVQVKERVTHTHRELEIGYVLDGAISLRTHQQTVLISKGDVYLVNGMEPHEFVSERNGALLAAIQFSPKLAEGFQTPETHFRYQGNPNLRYALEQEPECYKILCAACIELTYSFLRQQSNDEFRCFSLSASLMYLLHKNLLWTSLDYEDYSSLQQRTNRGSKFSAQAVTAGDRGTGKSLTKLSVPLLQRHTGHELSGISQSETVCVCLSAAVHHRPENHGYQPQQRFF